MAYSELIRVDAVNAIALEPWPWAVEWMVSIAAAAAVGALAAAWFHRRRG
jgi:MYXO-CTERM domain-containing protein